MGVRSTVLSFLSRPLENNLREVVDDVLATRRYATRSEVQGLRDEIGGSDAERLDALEKELAAVKKKLDMTMGALQAATAQLIDARQGAEEALRTSRQAMQKATSALATAESAADGVSALEDEHVEEDVEDDVEALDTGDALRLAAHDDGWGLFLGDAAEPMWTSRTKKAALAKAKSEAKDAATRLVVLTRKGKIDEEHDFRG